MNRIIKNKYKDKFKKYIKMQRKITKLPDDLNPIKIIERKMMTCPLCGTQSDGTYPYPGGFHPKYYYSDNMWADINGVIHKFLRKKNKYLWKRYSNIKCANCGCEWDTGWYPVDNKMFEIPINIDKQ